MRVRMCPAGIRRSDKECLYQKDATPIDAPACAEPTISWMSRLLASARDATPRGSHTTSVRPAATTTVAP